MSYWRDDAACRGMKPEVFFPGGSRDNPHRRRAVAEVAVVCHFCPVRAACARNALKCKASHGVFAGVDLGDCYREDEWLLDARVQLERVAKGAQ